MLFRLIVFKGVLAFLVIGSGFVIAIREGVNESLNSSSSHAAADSSAVVRTFRRYPLPLGCACAAVAFVAAFGDLIVAGRRKGTVTTYTDEEFLARFGGASDSQRPSS